MDQNNKDFYLAKLKEFESSEPRTPNQRRALGNMGEGIKNEKEEKTIIGLLDNYVLTTKRDKILPRKLALDFYEFLGEDVSQSQWVDITPITNPTIRQLEIAKFLHSPHSVGEICEKFGFSEDTIRADLLALIDGIELMGSYIRVQEERERGHRSYVSTLHPVFLPLNLSEVLLMTTSLLESTKDSVLADSYIYMVGRIYGQLSDYGKEKVKEQLPDDMVECLERIGNQFRDEQVALSTDDIEAKILFATKLRMVKSIRFVKDGEIVPLEIENAGVHSEGGVIRIFSEEGEEYVVRKGQILAIENVEYK